MLIPISDITGVGLVFKRHMESERPGGWYLRLWRVDGSQERTPISYEPLKSQTWAGANVADRKTQSVGV